MSFARLATRSAVSGVTKHLSSSLLRRAVVSQHRRPFTTANSAANGRQLSWLVAALAAAAGVSTISAGVALADSPSSSSPHDRPYDGPQVNYNEVRKDIAAILEKEDYDDGSLGPLFMRLAWHSSGSFSGEDGSGGSNGAHIRFAPQKFWAGNAGINLAIEELEPIKKKHPGISYGDLYTLCGVVACEEMGGPVIPWRPGRVDHDDASTGPQQDNRLPDAAQGAKHVRDVFYRMGFGDREIVALSGAHALGRCHRDRSGFEGPWTRSPTTFSNSYFNLLLNETWTEKQWNGPRQFENSKSGGDLMMLPTDMALIWDKSFRQWVETYAKDSELFYEDFSAAFSKLLELGVSFHASESKKWYRKIFG